MQPTELILQWSIDFAYATAGIYSPDVNCLMYWKLYASKIKYSKQEEGKNITQSVKKHHERLEHDE